MSITDTLFNFAYLGQWGDKLNKLESLALAENWKYKNHVTRNTQNPILENYIVHTFRRLAYEYNNAEIDEKNSIIFMTDKKACFNTGLFSKVYREIYASFVPNNKPGGTKQWFLVGFSDDSDPFFKDVTPLPRRAKYFSNIKELIFDTEAELRINSAHILNNTNNKSRIPEPFRSADYLVTLFDGAVALAKKIVQSNYKAAVPQFYNNTICHLLPICLSTPGKADLSLAVVWHDGYYTGHTCLTLDMAYNNARLIACPNSEWLQP